ncbi:DUF4352 domain-containing protein [Mycolicibacterium neoaurum]|uniref:DUF4352 domain-containing protein n=1 Tax=Mycolicibacterium neoaurum TaxID=1795 RepID=UPI00248C1B88|nr:DUF4352 domain-containing protein [Mycolicibacterium neoaurum]WBP93657.1 DUF4352 domain-containing protein [Mycolicibacterium neoaurum]WBS07450.1 DUF4352 domain-containing protein [Mycolicibacterium neoaurum]
MTTPPTAAGWYPDPDGSGGQRYWDGTEWTAQRPEGPEFTEETSAWPAELPPWPEDVMAMPSWEDAGKGEPPVIAADPEPEPEPEIAPEAEPADDDVQDPPVASEYEPEPEPEAEPEPADDAPAGEVEPSEQPADHRPQPDLTIPTVAPTTPAFDQTTAAAPTLPPPPAEPVAFGDVGAIEAKPAPKSPLKGYLLGVAALLIVLVGVLVWAFAFADPGSGSPAATGTNGTVVTDGATAPAVPTTDSDDASAAPAPAEGSVVDGDVAITQNGVDTVPTVSAVDNEFLTKTATGKFVLVKLTFLNNGQTPATFLSDQQVLTAGGQPYSPDTEATFYLNGISAVLYPGEPVQVTVAYDIPADSNPEFIQVSGDLGSAGGRIALN